MNSFPPEAVLSSPWAAQIMGGGVELENQLISPASWRLTVLEASITGCRRLWATQKYQRRKCLSPSPPLVEP